MKKAPHPRRKPVVEEIEPRILYSADFSPALLAAGPSPLDAEHRTLDAGGEFAAQGAQQQSAPATQNQQAIRHEVVFVDTATPDYQKLVDDIKAQSGASRQLDVVLLDPNVDGIKQISATLAGMQDVSAVHIIGHGTDGAIELGGVTLNFDSLVKNAAQIKGWGQALTAGADLLIYGCDVAQSADGKALVDALSRLTGADVAASENLTGAADKGGDWNLEYQDGQITTALALSAAEQQSYQDVLQSAPVGGETRANQTTANAQYLEPGAARQVAVAQDGSFVVTWVSQNQDTATSTGVYARRYAADGTALSAEILVNQTTANDQREAAVAIDANGNFVVTWTSQNQVSPTSGRDTYARRFSAAGSALGNEFLVNTTTAGDTDGPAIAMAANGRFAISWSDLSGLDGSAAGAYVRVYDAAGVAQTGEVQVNTTTAGNQYVDTVAMDSSGNFVVMGTADNVDGSGRAIYGQRFAADGTRLGTQFTVNTSTTGDQLFGSVAMNALGAFVVSWTDSNSSAGDIFAQRFNADGSKAGAQFQVNSTTANAQQYSSSGIDGNGNLVFTWASTGQDNGGTIGVYQREFNADGSARSAERLVNTTTANDQANPSMAMNALGQYVVVWQGNGPGDADGIFFQRYTPRGGPRRTTRPTVPGAPGRRAAAPRPRGPPPGAPRSPAPAGPGRAPRPGARLPPGGRGGGPGFRRRAPHRPPRSTRSTMRRRAPTRRSPRWRTRRIHSPAPTSASPTPATTRPTRSRQSRSAPFLGQAPWRCPAWRSLWARASRWPTSRRAT